MVQLVIDECFIIKFEIFHIFVPAIIVRPDNWALERWWRVTHVAIHELLYSIEMLIIIIFCSCCFHPSPSVHGQYVHNVSCPHRHHSLSLFTLLIFGTKCEGKFVPDDRMIHVASEHVQSSVLAWAGGRAGILTDSWQQDFERMCQPMTARSYDPATRWTTLNDRF